MRPKWATRASTTLACSNMEYLCGRWEKLHTQWNKYATWATITDPRRTFSSLVCRWSRTPGSPGRSLCGSAERAAPISARTAVKTFPLEHGAAGFQKCGDQLGKSFNYTPCSSRSWKWGSHEAEWPHQNFPNSHRNLSWRGGEKRIMPCVVTHGWCSSSWLFIVERHMGAFGMFKKHFVFHARH